jgi:dihydrofolate synthase/folylpolyglutamate synthase
MRKQHSDNLRLNRLLNTLASSQLPSIDLSLDRVHALLRALGNPHRKLPPVIHVAGTNGKGSLVAYLRAILERAGYRVHQYTSPYLVRFNEQIVVSGAEIKDDYLIEILSKIAPKLNNHPVTFFEATTIAAFMAFAENPADIVLLETGLGGRLDATNVIKKPALTAIVPISFDHQEFLGGTLMKIAAEKAGIIKCGVPCVLSSQENQSVRVIERVAKKNGAPLISYGKEWKIKLNKNGFTYQSSHTNLTLPLPNLAGKHQVYNAANAVACIEFLKHFEIDEDDIAYGITHAKWPARLQRLTKGDLQKNLPGNAELWLDGGHNEGAAEILASWVGEAKHTPLYVVCGMLKNKDLSSFIQHLAPYTKGLAAVRVPDQSGARVPDEIVEVAKNHSIGRAFSSSSVEGAIKKLVLEAASIGKTYRILICGSLYLAGHILRNNN